MILRELFLSYEQASGQKINFEKSSIAFSRNGPRVNQDFFASLLHAVRVDKHEKYLG